VAVTIDPSSNPASASSSSSGGGGGAQPQFVGSAPTPVVAPTTLLALEPSPPWYYMHHPTRWGLLGDEWLPILAELRIDPGVNGVDKSGSPVEAIADHQLQGWTLIPWTVIPGGYVRTYQGQKGPVSLSIWQTPRQVAGRAWYDVDFEGYKSFLRDLVLRGIIEAPDPSILEAIKRVQAEKLSGIAGDTAKGQAAREREQAILDRMEAAEVPTRGDA